ncbi:MAG TPA: malonyl-CoA decarboxylase family protein, partial [Hyphomicrobiaceae bacterium]|nr:malonyl-CoA decarboxylase family protein [Hyphomicrobiaceae bacterium]
MSNIAFLQELLNSVAETGRQLLPRSLFRGDPEHGLQALVEALMSGRGEASGVALARQLLRHYQLLDGEMKEVFFRYIAERLKPDTDRVEKAARAYLSEPSPRRLSVLQQAVESPRQEFFRRLNMAPGATAEIVNMRRDLLPLIHDNPQLAAIDGDIKHLLDSWFNRGFLVLRRIDWQTPAAILEKIIAYEAVHEISGWDELRRRLEPRDRRCFAFFHPSMIDEPLIFVEVALTEEMSGNVQEVLAKKLDDDDDDDETPPTTAVFYSISNCQKGLRGISFGNFLIKQVVEELSRECPTLRTFVTLSPVPGFGEWLKQEQAKPSSEIFTAEDAAALAVVSDREWHTKKKT